MLMHHWVGRTPLKFFALCAALWIAAVTAHGRDLAAGPQLAQVATSTSSPGNCQDRFTDAHIHSVPIPQEFSRSASPQFTRSASPQDSALFLFGGDGDCTAPYGFRWDCNLMPNGTQILVGSRKPPGSSRELVIEANFPTDSPLPIASAVGTNVMLGCPTHPQQWVNTVGINLKRYRALTIVARGDKGGEVVELKLGACQAMFAGKDSISRPVSPPVPIALSNIFQHYTMNLPANDDLSRIICPLAVWIHKGTGPDAGFAQRTIYIQSAYFN